jgi:hypothetical protein
LQSNVKICRKKKSRVLFEHKKNFSMKEYYQKHIRNILPWKCRKQSSKKKSEQTCCPAATQQWPNSSGRAHHCEENQWPGLAASHRQQGESFTFKAKKSPPVTATKIKNM